MDGKSYNEPSTRKGKKNSNSKTVKQPQRGLGVAQLEKLRLQNQIMANYNKYHQYPSSPSPFQSGSESEIGFVDASRVNNLYGRSHHNASVKTTIHGAENISLSHNYIGDQPRFAQCMEASMQTPSANYHYFFESNDSQEIDLELRL